MGPTNSDKHMRLVFLITFFSLLAFPLNAQDILREHGKFQVHHARSSLAAITFALQEAGDFVERNHREEEMVLHKTLAQFVKKTPGLRAIIATDKMGKLTIDSYNFPARPLDLKDRAYVKSALRSTARYVTLNKTVTGRTSGLSFIPLSRALFDVKKKLSGSLSAIVSPSALIHQDQLCTQCFVGLFTKEGELLVSYPSTATYPDGFRQLVKDQPDDSKVTHRFDDQEVFSWLGHVGLYDLRLSISKFDVPLQ